MIKKADRIRLFSIYLETEESDLENEIRAYLLELVVNLTKKIIEYKKCELTPEIEVNNKKEFEHLCLRGNTIETYCRLGISPTYNNFYVLDFQAHEKQDDDQFKTFDIWQKRNLKLAIDYLWEKM